MFIPFTVARMMSFVSLFCKHFKAYWPLAFVSACFVAGYICYATELDLTVYWWIMEHQSTSKAPKLQELYSWLSEIGQLEFKLVIGFAMMAYLTWYDYQPQWRMFWWRAILVISFTGLLVIPLKHIFGRPRPKMLRDKVESLYQMEWFEVGSRMHSFPSGHATTSWALCFFLTRYWPKYTPIWIFYAVSASYARMGIGAHYLGDVIAGSALGFFVAYWMWPKVAPAELQKRTQK